jgi:glycosyltransferase involved in cell wall biosynthesis
MLVSIVIPCYQNQNQIDSTVEQIINAVEEIDRFSFELVLVDDSSTDNTWQHIKDNAERFDQVKGIRLSENIGAYNAIVYGFEIANGELILVMAADGDDPPELLQKLVSHSDNSVDAVLAIRESSDKGLISVLLSKMFHFTLKLLGARNVYPSGSDFMIFRKELAQRCSQQGWKSGNTLIQIIQHANQTKTIGYRKGNSRNSTWTFGKKLTLFVQTMNQFIRIPGVSSEPKTTTVSDNV